MMLQKLYVHKTAHIIDYLRLVPMKDFFFKCEMSFYTHTFYKKGFPSLHLMGDNCEESQLNYLFTKEVQRLV